MRALLSKVAVVSMIAGAGLLVTACGGETPATVNNTEVEVPVENAGATDEMVTNIDGAATNAVVENVTDNATVGNEM